MLCITFNVLKVLFQSQTSSKLHEVALGLLESLAVKMGGTVRLSVFKYNLFHKYVICAQKNSVCVQKKK
jgi:hypothetical protein